MFNKLFSLITFSFMAITGLLSAEIKYDIQDIDTLQTHSSEAIALNNKGQILGWYNIDGSKDGKRFFVKNRDGSFHEIPGKTPDASLTINWQYLTDGGKAYGTFAVNQATTALCMWDDANGFIKLGVMPGREVVTINNAGQVLIKSVQENENGKTITRPVIWHNGKITKLSGLEGDLGIESDESYGFDMNNKGEVVGQSLVSLVYKNNIYYQAHATKWVNGKPIDLHRTVPKQEKTCATAINDKGNMVIHVLNSQRINNIDYTFNDGAIHYGIFKDGVLVNYNTPVCRTGTLTQKIKEDYDSLWLSVVKFIDVNDNGEIIAEGKTIYGEKHAMFLTPAGSSD